MVVRSMAARAHGPSWQPPEKSLADLRQVQPILSLDISTNRQRGWMRVCPRESVRESLLERACPREPARESLSERERLPERERAREREREPESERETARERERARERTSES